MFKILFDHLNRGLIINFLNYNIQLTDYSLTTTTQNYLFVYCMERYKDISNDDNKFKTFENFQSIEIENNSQPLSYWRTNYSYIVDSVNADFSIRSDSTIFNSLIHFQHALRDNGPPPLDFVIGDDVFSFFLQFLLHSENIDFKIKCICIIDYFITYCDQNHNELLINTISKNFLEVTLQLLMNETVMNDPQYYIIVYNITKLYKTCCYYSENFLYELLHTNFLRLFALPFISNFSLDVIISLPVDEHNTISTAFINIVIICGHYLIAPESVDDNITEYIMQLFSYLLRLENQRVTTRVCDTIKSVWAKQNSFPTILFENNFFELLWNVSVKQLSPSAMDILAQGLIVENLDKHVSSFIVIDDLISIFDETLNNLNTQKSFIDDEQKSLYESLVEATLGLIANYISFLGGLPANKTSSDMRVIVEKTFEYGNYHSKNCAAFLMLLVMSKGNFSKFDFEYEHDFIEQFFASLASGSDDVINKALEVFTEFLEKSVKLGYQFSQSFFLGCQVPEFFEEVVEMNHQIFSSIASNLLEIYYTDNEDG
ncbi:hypothetical protein TRFO_23444 [Tritrichomonas foetus]|uniref:Uncharacterized protein n=1 Tax=Tritrichomonas foetus TaxID=1144522 RepID=A0A1J4K9Q8_9EUKA|nr:hypothetical protein TRFO_23444 [Tritrichomonas foetus]|eukprot:OHT08159.1 hypothetical protein TRFO_23444 [Tritrichomonas foetus]